MDPADLVQDAHELFYKCAARYANSERCVNRANFIALFKSALLNYMTTVGKKNVRMPERFASDICEDETRVFNAATPPEEGFAELQAGPVILSRLMIAIERGDLSSPYVTTDGKRETTNERLCRIVGLDPNTVNLADDLRAYLSAH